MNGSAWLLLLLVLVVVFRRQVFALLRPLWPILLLLLVFGLIASGHAEQLIQHIG